MGDDMGDKKAPDSWMEAVVHSANEAFRSSVLAIADDDDQGAKAALMRFINLLDGTNENPFQHLTRASVTHVAIVLRKKLGDPEPDGPPAAPFSGTVLVVNQTTGEMPHDTLEEFAMGVVSEAANWNFGAAEDSLAERINRENESGDTTFILRLINFLVHIFIQLDGIEEFGWKRGTPTS